MKKLLYVSEGIGISETFIAELSRGLSTEFEVTHIVADEPFYKEGINYKIKDFDLTKSSISKMSYIFASRGRKLAYHSRCRKATKVLNSYVKNCDYLYIEYGTTATRLLNLIKRYKKPTFVHFHGFDITSQLNLSWYRTDLKILFEHATGFFVPSDHIKRLLILNGCPEKKVKVVRLGISIPDNTIVPFSERKNDLIFVGRFTPKKNPVALIHAFKRVLKEIENIKLHLVGEGPLKKECENLVNSFSLNDNVIFHGALKHEDTISLVKNTKIYVQHSVTSYMGDQEGFPVSLAEAAVLGLPIVSTLHNGIPENVVDGRTGFLVREYDYESMGDKIIQLFQDPELAARMGIEGQKRIKSICSSTKRIKEIASTIKLSTNN